MARLRAAGTGVATATSAAACLLALSLAFAACGGGNDDRATATGPSSSVGDTTSTTAEPATTSTTAAAVAPTTRRGPATSPPSTAAPGGPAAAAPAGPAAVKPPAAGTYRYATTGSTAFGLTTVPFPGVTTLAVDPAAGTRQRSSRDLRDAAGVGPLTEFTLDYRADGLYLELLRLTVSAGAAFTDTRELRPASPTLFLPTGARPGTSLAIDLPTATGVAKVTIDVLGEERVVVGGQGVDTLQVRMVATLPPGDVTGRQELTLDVDRVSGLWVKERSVTEGSAGGGLVQLHSQYEATLQRLTPG